MLITVLLVANVALAAQDHGAETPFKPPGQREAEPSSDDAKKMPDFHWRMLNADSEFAVYVREQAKEGYRPLLMDPAAEPDDCGENKKCFSYFVIFRNKHPKPGLSGIRMLRVNIEKSENGSTVSSVKPPSRDIGPQTVGQARIDFWKTYRVSEE